MRAAWSRGPGSPTSVDGSDGAIVRNSTKCHASLLSQPLVQRANGCRYIEIILRLITESALGWFIDEMVQVARYASRLSASRACH